MVIAFLPGEYRPLLKRGMPLRLEIQGYRYAYQHLTMIRWATRSSAPPRRSATWATEIADAVQFTGPVVRVEAQLTSGTFEADGSCAAITTACWRSAEVRIRSERVLVALIPALKAVFETREGAVPERPRRNRREPDGRPAAEAARSGWALHDRFPALHKLAFAGRRQRVPFVQQNTASDCGAASLTMVLGLPRQAPAARRRAQDHRLRARRRGRPGDPLRRPRVRPARPRGEGRRGRRPPLPAGRVDPALAVQPLPGLRAADGGRRRAGRSRRRPAARRPRGAGPLLHRRRPDLRAGRGLRAAGGGGRASGAASSSCCATHSGVLERIVVTSGHGAALRARGAAADRRRWSTG